MQTIYVKGRNGLTYKKIVRNVVNHHVTYNKTLYPVFFGYQGYSRILGEPLPERHLYIKTQHDEQKW